MSPRPTEGVRREAHPTSAPEEEEPGARTDHAYLVPIGRLFSPEPDPTEAFPGETTSLEGYVVAPNRVVTLALAVATPASVPLLDAVWAAVRRKGVGLRRLTVLNDRGRVVALITVRLEASERFLSWLESQLLVPVRTRNGLAEVHLLATAEDFDALKRQLRSEPLSPAPATVGSIPPVHDTGALVPQDWAFLGLLSAVGAFDGPEAVRPAVLAEALGIDLEVFAERARTAERGLQGLVQGLFGPSATTAGSGVAVA